MKIRKGMTSRECFENKWFYMKYIGKYLSVEMYNKKSITLCFNKTELLARNYF
jgi:hypothetical protein